MNPTVTPCRARALQPALRRLWPQTPDWTRSFASAISFFITPASHRKASIKSAFDMTRLGSSFLPTKGTFDANSLSAQMFKRATCPWTRRAAMQKGQVEQAAWLFKHFKVRLQPLPAGSVFETGRHKVTCFDTQSRSTSCSITHAGSLHLEQTMLPATPVSPLQLSEVHQWLELANVLHQLWRSQALHPWQNQISCATAPLQSGKSSLLYTQLTSKQLIQCEPNLVWVEETRNQPSMWNASLPLNPGFGAHISRLHNPPELCAMRERFQQLEELHPATFRTFLNSRHQWRPRSSSGRPERSGNRFTTFPFAVCFNITFRKVAGHLGGLSNYPTIRGA